jgi:hypothetical protein
MNNIDINGTSRMGEVTTTLRRLREVFGNPILEQPSQWEKVGYEWVIKIDDLVATIYDWKRYTTIPLGEDELHTFNIGGFKPEAADFVKACIKHSR